MILRDVGRNWSCPEKREMRDRSPDQIAAWLRGRPSLHELREAFPDEWIEVERGLAEAGRTGNVELLRAPVVLSRRDGVRPASTRTGASLRAEVRRRMLIAAVEQRLRATAAGVEGGRIRFNLFNGYIAQKLLFARGLERKPVSLFWFKIWWPLVWQRRYLMPLVSAKGIYCFYSRRFVRELAALIGDRSCVEIAAGDGTLARFLRSEGVDALATDDHSWSHQVTYPDDVVREDAAVSLRKRRPEVVVCSWPPAGNSFERLVFQTPTVEVYVMIGSRHRFATGNWDDYEQQADFDGVLDQPLSRLMLPHELESAVYVFRRRSPSASTGT